MNSHISDDFYIENQLSSVDPEDVVLSGYICQLFVSRQKRDCAIKLVSSFLQSFSAKRRCDVSRKFLFLNNGRFNSQLPDNLGVYGFLVPFFSIGDANSIALLSQSALAFCEFYTFGVHFDNPEFHSSYYRYLDDDASALFLELSRLPLGK